MKKYLSLVAITIMVFTLGANFSRAEDGKENGQSLTPSEIKAKIDEIRKHNDEERVQAMKRIEDLKNGIKEKDEVKEKQKDDRISGRQMAIKRFDTAESRMIELKDRVNAQIAKLETKGVDVNPAKDKVLLAETKLITVGEKITEITTLLASSPDKLSKDTKTKLVTLDKDIQVILKEVRSDLNDAVKSLKDAVKAKLEVAKPKSEDNDKDENGRDDEGENTPE